MSKQVSRNSLRLLPRWAAGVVVAMAASGCSPYSPKPAPEAGEVFLSLPPDAGAGRTLDCGAVAARQLIRFYHPQIDPSQFKTDALVLNRADDTVSILFFLRDNLAAPVELKNGHIDALFASIGAGHPCVVFVPVDTFAPNPVYVADRYMYHCLVLAGHNSKQTALFFYSDGDGPYVIDRRVFEDKWRRTDNLCILIKEPPRQ